jgi:hypothetical protein
MQAAAGPCALQLPLRGADQASSSGQTSRSECRCSHNDRARSTCMRRHECRSGQPYTASVLHLAICEALGAVDASMLATFAPKHLLSLSDAYVRPLVLAPAPRPCFDSPEGSLGEIRPGPASRQKVRISVRFALELRPVALLSVGWRSTRLLDSG